MWYLKIILPEDTFYFSFWNLNTTSQDFEMLYVQVCSKKVKKTHL